MEQHNPPHPGEVLMELYIRPQYKNIAEFSRASKIYIGMALDLIKGKHRIGIISAHRLAEFFKTDIRFWLNLQMEYDIWQYKKFGKVNRKSPYKKTKPEPPSEDRSTNIQT